MLEKQKGNFQKFHFGLYHQKSVKEKKICFPPTTCGILVAESLSARQGNVRAILLNSELGMARNAKNVTLVAQLCGASQGGSNEVIPSRCFSMYACSFGFIINPFLKVRGKYKELSH